MRMVTEKLALDYARDECGYANPVIKGKQVDRKVAGTVAYWVADAQETDNRMGLIVNDRGGVLTEFDYDEAEPGKLPSGGASEWVVGT